MKRPLSQIILLWILVFGVCLQTVRAEKIPDRSAQLIADLTSEIQEKPNEASLYVSRAHFYEQTKELQKAISDYETALKLDTGLKEQIYDTIIKMYTKEGDFDNAVKVLMGQFKDSSKNPKFWEKRAQIYVVFSDLDKALEDYKTAEKMAPEDVHLLMKMGNLYLKKNAIKDAKAYFSKALAILKKSPRETSKMEIATLNLKLCIVEVILSDGAEARSYFKEAVTTSPEYVYRTLDID